MIFSLKSQRNLFYPKIYGMTDIFILFKKDVSTDQYVLKLLNRSIIFLINENDSLV